MSVPAEEAALLFEAADGVATITMNRPKKMNAINNEMREGLLQAWERVEADPDIRVAILTGAGPRAFCAGRDLAAATGAQTQFLPFLGDNVSVGKPVIAAVNGLAYGGGWFFVQMCDIAVAAENATFALPEARFGRAPHWGAWLHGMVPQKVALELLLTGNAISAQRAYEIGLVNHVVPADQLMAKARQLAADIVACAPLSVQGAKAMVYAAAEMGRGAALRTAQQIFARAYDSEDAREGAAAFKEGRKPVWRGK
ncbi:MAG: enoyl-CoA hydratase/isomerase family protein [Reyranellaceae bacterium]